MDRYSDQEFASHINRLFALTGNINPKLTHNIFYFKILLLTDFNFASCFVVGAILIFHVSRVWHPESEQYLVESFNLGPGKVVTMLMRSHLRLTREFCHPSPFVAYRKVITILLLLSFMPSSIYSS